MRRHLRSSRLVWLIAAVLVGELAVVSCSDNADTLTGPPPNPPPPDNSAVVVTEPVEVDLATLPPILASGTVGENAFSFGTGGVEEVSFVSYAPGSIPEADSIEVRNLTRDLLVGAPMVGGGVDPIAVPASVGDTLEITVLRQTLVFELTARAVPEEAPPRVVRTKPPRGRTRVPLNSIIVIVFTEPIAPKSVTTQTIRLLQNGQPIPATVLRSADGLSIELVPTQPLLHATSYSISITTGVLDLADDALEQEFTSDLTTIAAQLVGEIAFESNRNGANEIYLMKTDGSDVFQLTDAINGLLSTAPAISPDGRQVAFSLADPAGGGDWEIYRINVDGTGLTNLSNSPAAFDGWRPAWSPDGSQIAFFSTRDDPLNEDIYVVNADGTGVTRLTTNPASDAHPSWSPDGSRIVFVTNRDGDFDLYVMNADGSNPSSLTADPADDDWPAWSPDGSKIAFESVRDGNPEIYVMNADGTNVVRLTNDPGFDSSPAWSRDGSQIAFSSDRAFAVDIWIMNSDGTGLVNLTGGVCCNFFPSWSP